MMSNLLIAVSSLKPALLSYQHSNAGALDNTDMM
jgi:hypothetical protein